MRAVRVVAKDGVFAATVFAGVCLGPLDCSLLTAAPSDLDESSRVKVRAAVAEEAPLGAIALDRGEIEASDQHAVLLLAEARDELAHMVGHEGMAVISLARSV